MRRRDFLYNTGLLLPAVLFSPSSVLASQKTINAEMLIIHDDAGLPDHVAAAFNKLPVTAQHCSHAVQGREITHLSYSKNGFLVTTNDNSTFNVQKLVVHTSHRLHVPKSSVEINTGNKSFHLEYVSMNDKNKVTPEFWFLKTTQFHTNRVQPFLNRNRHAVMCLSA